MKASAVVPKTRRRKHKILSTCLLSVPDVPVQCPGTDATQGTVPTRPSIHLLRRRAIILGVEQVTELMQRRSKTEGLLEKLGIDFGAIPGQEEVFSTSVINRVQRQQVKMASHGLKRQRVQELEAELMNTSLPDRKRLRWKPGLCRKRERQRSVQWCLSTPDAQGLWEILWHSRGLERRTHYGFLRHLSTVPSEFHHRTTSDYCILRRL
jgi:hypothetical protein